MTKYKGTVLSLISASILILLLTVLSVFNATSYENHNGIPQGDTERISEIMTELRAGSNGSKYAR